MKTKLPCCALAAILLVLGYSGHAQTAPSLVNYQGKLTDASGNPLPNGNYGVAFRIWNRKSSTEAGNQLIWGQEYNLTVQNGIFNVILGAPGGTPIPSAAVNDLAFAFTDTQRYFGITVSRGATGIVITNAMEIAPRQQFLSSPYSFRANNAFLANAANALNAPGGGPTNVVFVTSGGAVGVGTTNPATMLDVNGQVKATAFIGDGSQLTGLGATTLNTPAGTFSANTAYQNTSGFKLLVVWFGTQCNTGGWGGINQRGWIGLSTPNIQVAAVTFALPGNGEVTQSAAFVVPNGWYWQVSNASGTVNCVGTVQRIEAWQIE